MISRSFKCIKGISRLFCLFILLSVGSQVCSQDSVNRKLYNPAADAAKEIEAAIEEAKASNRHVFIQVGGNWCGWCLKFDLFLRKDSALMAFVKKNYVICHVNYSPENKNAALMAKYRFPNRLGFPVFLIVNEKGELIHTQNTAYLEEKDHYDPVKVKDFFRDWSPRELSNERWEWLERSETGKSGQ
jgi:thioredoxin-related protein